MPSWNTTIGPCAGCCDTPAVSVTCTSRFTSSATLQGWEPCGGDVGECVRYRRWSISGTQVRYTNCEQPPGSDPVLADCSFECGDPVYGGERTYTETFDAVYNWGGPDSGYYNEDATGCSGPGFTWYSPSVPLSSSVDLSGGNSVIRVRLMEYACEGNIDEVTDCGYSSSQNTWCRGTRTRTVTSVQSLPDSWHEARLRSPGTTGSSCCAVTGPRTGCSEGSSVEVTMLITVENGAPNATVTIRITFNDATTMDIEAELDALGGFSDSVMIPQPPLGSSRCYSSFEVIA